MGIAFLTKAFLTTEVIIWCSSFNVLIWCIQEQLGHVVKIYKP